MTRDGIIQFPGVRTNNFFVLMMTRTLKVQKYMHQTLNIFLVSSLENMNRLTFTGIKSELKKKDTSSVIKMF